MSDKTKPTHEKEIGFKAEIKQLLNILINSLYKEREIFLRELVSNASDALTQMDFVLLTNRDVLDPEAELAIWIDIDKERQTLTIRDTGIGMTKDEMEKNLGTIAQSGAKEFINAAQNDKNHLAEIIGQFGVGFYSVFMVAEWVKVTSRSYQRDAHGASWYSEGGDVFILDDADKEKRGTIIEIKLNKDSLEFLEETRIKEIIRKHSNFVKYPIYVGNETTPVNSQTAIWRRSPKELKKQDYEEFYRHLTMEFDPPMDFIHFIADAPLQIYAVLYIPHKAEKSIFSLRKDDGLKLYVKNVLIQEYAKELLPHYLRFMQGVVDAEDIPLNVSREVVQSNVIIQRINKILTKQVLNKLSAMKDKERENYDQFWNEFGAFIREGIASEQNANSELPSLVLFKTNRSTEKSLTFHEYIGRMKPGQNKIYYLLADDFNSALRSPHLDYFQKYGYEVILFDHPLDAFMLLNLRKFEGFDLENIASPDIILPKSQGNAKEDDQEEKTDEDDGNRSQIISLFKNTLEGKIADVRMSDRLENSIARLVNEKGAPNQEIQKVYHMLNKEIEKPKKILEINPKHEIIQGLPQANKALAAAIIKQVYHNALLLDGQQPEPTEMLTNIQEIMKLAIRPANRETKE